MSKVALIFPGQGSQAVGMGKDFFDNSDIAKDIFNQVDSILGRSLSSTCFEGPEEDLRQTTNTQPAIMTVSIIAYELLKAKCNMDFAFTAGHSLGEYSALYAAGVLDLESAVKLIQKRSELMDKAPAGAMTAVIGLAQDKLIEIEKELAASYAFTIANYNTPDQLVISGDKDAVAQANEMVKEAGAKRAIPLPVSGAFHSPLMEKPAQEFAQEVCKYTFNAPVVPVVTNIDAQPTQGGFDQKLVKQIHSSVRWTQTIEFMKDNGVEIFVELGPGKVLSGMVKKIDRKLTVVNIEDMSSLEAAAERLGQTLSV